MKYSYPVIFVVKNGKTIVNAPDLEGCMTFGNDLNHAREMVCDAMSLWLCIAEDNDETAPKPSENLNADDGVLEYITVDTTAYRQKTDNKPVKKTLSIPNWLNKKAESEGINFSQTLQRALKEQLGIAN